MNRAFFSLILRSLGLIYFGDRIRYILHYLKNFRANKKFRRANPSIALPPDYLIYESFRMDYNKYYFGGLESARWLISVLEKHASFKNLSILDWGCGPGRIVRHLPSLLDKSCKIYGADYNLKSIEWCRENIKDIDFYRNSMSPPMQYDNDSFDIILGLSIFTHLSEEMHNAWLNELQRIMRKNGILLLSTQGEAFLEKLSGEEIKKFNNGQLVVRGKTREGHRTYSAFQSPAYMKNLISANNILEFIEGEKSKRNPGQDVWIIRVT